MGILRRLFFGEGPKQKTNKRAYAAAQHGRLYSSWTGSNKSADSEIYPALETLRARSRDLAINNEYAIRFRHLAKVNIVGHQGITLQARIKDRAGNLDKLAIKIVEAAWWDFCRKQNLTVTRQLSMVDLENLLVDSVIRDGEIFFRKVENWKGNKYRFALQPIEADACDTQYNAVLPNGNRVVMGVEKNSFGEPVAYWFLTRHPGDDLAATYQRRNRERISAVEIIHFFIVERVGQTRGVPWLIGSAARAKILDGMEEAELVASRVGAAQMGFVVAPNMEPDEDLDEETREQERAAAMQTFDAEPGVFRTLPEGFDVKTFDPKHPTTAFPAFNKSVLRGIAAGWNVSYHSLANDLENINLSSVRHGEMVDRDHWKVWHTRLIEHFLDGVFASWLEWSLTAGALGLPLSDFTRLGDVGWRPRGWHRVDPDKESKATTRDVGNHTKSIFEAANEKGGDLEEILEDNARARDLAKDYGFELHIFEGGKDEPSEPGDQAED